MTNSCAATGSAGATLAVVKGPACPADIDGDGAVGASDLAQLLGAWGEAGALGPADLDQSGAVNSADLAQLLGAWGACE